MTNNVVAVRETELINLKLNDYIVKKYNYPFLPVDCRYIILKNPSVVEIKDELKNIEENAIDCILIAIVPETHMLLLKTLFEQIIVISNGKVELIETIILNHKNIEAKSVSFTSKEVLFLKEVAYGLNNKEIAYELMLSDRSVRRIKEKLLSKTGLSNTQQLMLYAINKGY